MAPVVAPERRWLEEHTDRWVGAGLISPGEARAIRRFESTVSDERRPERFGLVAEVAAYLGCVLALMGGAVVVGARWDELTPVARLALAAAIALIGLTAGAWLVSFDEPGTNRLGGFLRALGVAGIGGFAGIGLHELDVRADVAAVLVGALVAASGLALWRNLDRPLQLITAVVGIGIALGGFVEITHVAVWSAGVAVWLAGGALFGAAAGGLISPRLVGQLTGYIVAMTGAGMLAGLDERLGPSVMALTAAAIVALGLRWRERALLIGGVIGSLVAVQGLLQTTFTSVVAAAIVALIGLAVVAVVVIRARRPA